MKVLTEISIGSFDCKSKFMARNLISQWSKFENLFMAFVLLDVFLVTSPVSKYLQSKNLDYSTAWNMIQTLLQQINTQRSDKHFEVLHSKTKTYARKINACFEKEIDI